MSESSIAVLNAISQDEPNRRAFNIIFKGATIVPADILHNTHCMIGPLAIINLAEICIQHKKNKSNIVFAVYNNSTIHLIFSDNASLSVILTKDTFSYAETKSAKNTWVRIQNFYYGHTSRSVSHAKKAPADRIAGLTLDQTINRYSRNRDLT